MLSRVSYSTIAYFTIASNAQRLPGSLANAGNLALVCSLAEADTADAVVAQVSMGTTADLAAIIAAGHKLGFPLLLENHSFSCHFFFLPD